jgi:hypothetical protein
MGEQMVPVHDQKGAAMRQRLISGLGAVALVLVSCGAVKGTPTAKVQPSPTRPAAAIPTATPTATAMVSSAPTAATNPSPDSVSTTGKLPASCLGSAPATPSPAGEVIAVMDGQELELLSAAGAVLNTLSGVDTAGGPSVIGTTQDGAYLWNSSTGVMQLLGLSGPPHTLGTTSTSSESDLPSPPPPSVSPNGACWVLSDVSWDADFTVATTQLSGGVFGGPVIHLATLTRSNGDGGGYSLLGWSPTSVLLGTDPEGVGGGGPGFELSADYSFMKVVLMDPSAGTISSQPLCTGEGTFQALSDGGTLVACRETSAGSVAHLEVGPTDGPMVSIDTGAGTAGAVDFAPDGSALTFCTLDGPTAGGYPETLWSVPLGGASTERSLMTQNEWSGCGGYVVGGGFAVVLAGENPSPGAPGVPVDVIELSTGATTTIGTADSIVGVL